MLNQLIEKALYNIFYAEIVLFEDRNGRIQRLSVEGRRRLVPIDQVIADCCGPTGGVSKNDFVMLEGCAYRVEIEVTENHDEMAIAIYLINDLGERLKLVAAR